MAPQLRELLCRHRAQGTALNDDLAGAGGDETIQQPQQGGFSRAGKTHHHKDLAGANLHGDILDGSPHPMASMQQLGVRSRSQLLNQLWRRSPEQLPDGLDRDL